MTPNLRSGKVLCDFKGSAIVKCNGTSLALIAPPGSQRHLS